MHTLEQIFERFPLMRNALQPPKLPMRNGTWHFDGAAEWAKFEETLGEFRFRVPATGNEPTLCGPFRAVGDCLEPFSEHGDLCYFDPTIEPQDGDLLLVAWTNHYLASKQGQGMLAGWREQMGFDAGPIATKRLLRFGNSWLLQVNTGAFHLRDFTGEPNARVLGVMRWKLRGGQPLYELPQSHHIRPNAATDTVYSFVAGPVAVSSGDSDLTSVSFSLAATTSVQVTATLDATHSVGSLSGRPYLQVATSGGTVYGTDASEYIYGGGNYQRVALSLNLSLPPGSFVAKVVGGVPGATTATHKNITLRVEAVKR